MSTCAKMLTVRKSVRACDRTEPLKHHNRNATRGGTTSDLRDIARPLIAAPSTFVVAPRLQNQNACILAEDARQACQHLCGRVSRDSSVQDADWASLRP
jgi:hypothetical protein